MMRFAGLVLIMASGFASLTATGQEKGKTADNLSLVERLPAKIQKIQTELPAWLQKTGNKEAFALMQRMREQIEAQNFEEVEKTADSILKMMGAGVPNAAPTDGKQSGKPASDSPEETTRRLTEKVERVMAGAQKWAASGRDPAEIIKTMQERFQPLMQTGKVVEAEAVVDGVLKLLGMDVKASAAVPASEPSAEERVLTRIHLIQKELPAWVNKTGQEAEADALMQKLKEQLATMNFAEAEKTADAVLKLMGLSVAPPARTESTMAHHDSKPATDPFAAFFSQQLVFLASDRIALTQDQKDTLRARVNSTQPRLEELQAALEGESAALTALTSQERLDEAMILAQLGKVLDVEREAKQLQVVLGITIQNLLTSEQHTRLRELTGNPDAVMQLEEEVSQRINAKVERVMAGAHKWAESGRDASTIARTMQEKVRPLMDSGNVFEAETELDHVLEQLNKETK